MSMLQMAFLMEGVMDYLVDHNGDLDHYEGMGRIEFVELVLEPVAEQVAQLLAKAVPLGWFGDAPGGVFEYDVTGALGFWIAVEARTPEQICDKFVLLASEFFGKDVEQVNAVINAEQVASVKVPVQAIETMFSFSSEQHWINKAQGWYGSIPNYRRENFLTVDAAGRVCTCGAHFMRATRENTYPVTVYRVNQL